MRRAIITTKLISLMKASACVLLAATASTAVRAEYYMHYSEAVPFAYTAPPRTVSCSSCQVKTSCCAHRRHYRRPVRRPTVIVRPRTRCCDTAVYYYARPCAPACAAVTCTTCSTYRPCRRGCATEAEVATNDFYVEEYAYIGPDFDMRSSDDVGNYDPPYLYP